MHNGKASLQVCLLEALKRMLYLRPNRRLGRWVDFETEDARRAGRRKPEHIRKIGVQGDQNASLADRKLPNPSIRFA